MCLSLLQRGVGTEVVLGEKCTIQLMAGSCGVVLNWDGADLLKRNAEIVSRGISRATPS